MNSLLPAPLLDPIPGDDIGGVDLSFAAVFAGLGIVSAEGDLLSPVLLILGVFAGSMLWWLILSGTVNLLRQKFDPQRLKWINQLSGFIIAGFGAYCLFSL